MSPDEVMANLIEQASELAIRDHRPKMEAVVAYLQCPYRGRVLTTIDARKAGCGCASTTVEVFHCQYFKEAVLQRVGAGCAPRLKGEIQGFTGRTCRECKVPGRAGIRILLLTPRKDWQDQEQRSRYALAQHELGVLPVELAKPSVNQVQSAIEEHRPRLVINHAYSLSVSETIGLAREHGGIQFVVVDHGSPNHTFTWPSFLSEWRKALEASESLPNVWASSPDPLAPWRRLGCKGYLRWHNPVYLPPLPDLPAPLEDPPTVAIVGRTDWVKALPVQISGAAIVQRNRPLQVSLVLNGSPERKAGLRDFAKSCGLKFESVEWLEPGDWGLYLRDHVSIVLQTSFSESFNYATIDAAGLGRPFVGSLAIRHTPSRWRVRNPNDSLEVAQVIDTILDDYPQASMTARRVAKAIASRNNRQYVDLVKSLTRQREDSHP